MELVNRLAMKSDLLGFTTTTKGQILMIVCIVTGIIMIALCCMSISHADDLWDRRIQSFYIVIGIVFILTFAEIATLATEPSTGEGTIEREYGKENVTFLRKTKGTYNSFIYEGNTYFYTTDRDCTTVYVYKSK